MTDDWWVVLGFREPPDTVAEVERAFNARWKDPIWGADEARSAELLAAREVGVRHCMSGQPG